MDFSYVVRTFGTFGNMKKASEHTSTDLDIAYAFTVIVLHQLPKKAFVKTESTDVVGIRTLTFSNMKAETKIKYHKYTEAQ